jgi:hypothetical protein
MKNLENKSSLLLRLLTALVCQILRNYHYGAFPNFPSSRLDQWLNTELDLLTTMPSDEELSDSYVAELLKKDAKSLANGIYAAHPKR